MITVGEPRDDMGLAVCKLTIRTKLCDDVAPAGKMLKILAGLNRQACSSAALFDEVDRSISLHSSFYVHEANMVWVFRCASFALLAQMAKAQLLADGLAPLVRKSGGSVRMALSAHPAHGVRSDSDDMGAIMRGLRDGAAGPPHPYGLVDFKESTETHGPDPSLMTNFDEGGLVAEFQYHGQAPATAGFFARLLGRRSASLGSALFMATAGVRHPTHGPGCLTLLTLPVSDEDPELVNRLNLQERDDWTRAQGMGAWCLGDKGITHTAFLPDAMHRPGTFGMIYRNAAIRAAWAGRFLA